ncbi:hypothetical protein Nepgr_013575 [Nepenthes gracilis]|uniref:Secreted protein n=1 Tax=Nepenthes gracilis TaxID=150966 RepID=A0AAD3SJD2_NEPGR|nr:hypothetical protein Nepgr_013575 [Nepenthes gracilis]
MYCVLLGAWSSWVLGAVGSADWARWLSYCVLDMVVVCPGAMLKSEVKPVVCFTVGWNICRPCLFHDACRFCWASEAATWLVIVPGMAWNASG